jgi:hypothetical protein
MKHPTRVIKLVARNRPGFQRRSGGIVVAEVLQLPEGGDEPEDVVQPRVDVGQVEEVAVEVAGHSDEKGVVEAH